MALAHRPLAENQPHVYTYTPLTRLTDDEGIDVHFNDLWKFGH